MIILCSKCKEAIEIPDELVGDHTEADIQNYVCDGCDDGLADDGDYEYDDDDGYCDMCNGEGIIITCCDDMCVGGGHCIHGDGEMICPKCYGGY